jgi:uncharacterized protein YbgA (DUF1722 family)/uncharacterized protein YbbK (DUF523 family)
MPEPIRIGISSCLLGEHVRFDGGHKRDSFLVETFGKLVEWVPVCPEVECGFGTPRQSMRLVREDRGIRLLTTKSREDLTSQMTRYSAERSEQLAQENLSGYVLKKDSPSCGLERVKVYAPQGTQTRTGRGIFAMHLIERFPHLPVEEEGRLSDPRLRDNFVERVFAYWRLRALFSGGWDRGALVRFHTAHKMALLAHSTTAYNELGRLVAGAGAADRNNLRREYEPLFMRTMAIPATRARHANVLHHMAGHLKTLVDDGSRAELAACIDEYRRGFVPLIVPVTLIRHHVRRFGVEYLGGQIYLDPHPRELMLRNHV